MATQDTPAATDGKGLPGTGLILLLSLGLFWGLNWPAMKIGLGEITVWWFRAMSVTAGGLGLLAISALAGQRLIPNRSEIRPMLLCTLFAIMGWHLFTGYGVSMMPAGRASIIAYTMPVWAAALAPWMLGERVTGYLVAGLALGVAGLAILIGPDLAVLGAAPLGAMFMLAAAITWAIGTMMFKMFTWSSPTGTVVGWQLTFGAIPITIGALASEPVPDPTLWSTEVWIAMTYLFTLPMVFCQWAYFYVVKIMPASVAAIGTLLVPVVGLLSSALVLGEPLGWQEITAMLLISAALFVVMVLPELRRKDI